MTGTGSTPRARGLAAVALALALATSVLGLNGVVQPTQAHTGSGEDVRQVADFWYSLEGEAFTKAPAECDPDYDFEHTEPKTDGDASGDEVVFLPHSGCWVAFDNVHFPNRLILTNMTKAINGEAQYDRYETATYRVSIFVDGSEATTFEFTQDKHDGLVTTDITDPVIVSEGTHDIRIKYKVVEGMDFQNLRIDNLKFLKGCVNTPPTLDSISVDGMLDGFIGWRGYDYDYAAQGVSDPDGDPVDVTWHWPDGTTSTGETATKALDLDSDSTDLLAELKDVTLELVDEPTCDKGKVLPETTEIPFDFMVTPALEPGILNLAQGLSCVQGDVIDTSRLLNMGDFVDRDALIGLCDDFGAATDTNGAPAELVNATWVEKDGERLLTASGDELDQDLDGRDLVEGNLSLRACADAVNDKYDRVFCGSGLELVNSHCTNAAPVLDSVSVDGMLDGLVGWNRYNYTFDAATSDPDGDPVDVSWRWSDGTAASGDPVSTSFDIGDPSLDLLAETLGLELDLADDPTVRCPDLPVLPQGISELGPDFTVAPAFDISLLNLVGSISCVEGKLMDTSRLVNLRDDRDAVVGSCDSVGADADTNGAPSSMVDETWVQMDSGAPYLSSNTTSVEGPLDVADFELGNATFKGCADAVNDKYDRVFCTGTDLTLSDCTNAAPSLKDVSVDGMLDGLVGWNRYNYTFDAATSDPDGDPVDVSWRWSDGTAASGDPVSTSFDIGDPSLDLLAETLGLELDLADDPTVRCPDLPVLPQTASALGPDFTVAPAFDISLLNLVGSISCVEGKLMDTSRLVNLRDDRDAVVGSCDSVGADSDTNGAPESLVDETWVQADANTPYMSSNTTSVEGPLDVADFELGNATFKGCTDAVNDKYDRVFCTGTDLTFSDCTNDAPSVGTVDANGLASGLSGWSGYDYTFQTSPSDPDGDAVDVTWIWDDGTSLSGHQVTRSFDLGSISSPALQDLILKAVDDPTVRCDLPALPQVVQTSGPSFEVVPDLQPDLPDLKDGVSCIDGDIDTLPWTDDNLLSRQCPVDAATDAGGADHVVDETMVRVDGNTIASATGTEFTADYDASDFADGEHFMEACATGVNDVHDRLFCGPGWTYTDVECTNRAPELTDPSANGMLGGFVGWAGYPYQFTVDAHDPDGDPVTVTWNFPDGTSFGEKAQRTFDQAGVHDVELVVEDDTSERCPGVSDRSTTVQLTFETVDPPQDWSAALQQPSDGESCVEGRVYTTPTGEDTIAGTCEVRASLTTSGSGTGIDLVLPDAVGELRVDGVPFKQVTAQGTDQISAIYDSGDYEPGEHVLESCVHVTGDVHGLEFCSSNDYLNVAS